MLLKNDRILLRLPRKTDAAACVAAIEESRKELIRFTVGPPLIKSLRDEEAFIERCIQRRKKKTDYLFGIFDAKDKSYLGNIGLHCVSPFNRSSEIGYWIRTGRSGFGLATASAALVVRFGFEELKLHKIVLRAIVDNLASIRVAEKIGFVREGIQRHELRLERGWVDLQCFSLIEFEYRKLKAKITRLSST